MQGLSLVVGSHNGEDVLISFGGYNGRYSNEVKTYIYYFVGFQSPVCSSYYRLFIVYLFLGQCS